MSSRADRVAARLAPRGLDLLLVTDMVNLRYLTGFTGSSAFAVVGTDVRRFITDFRYVEQAAQQVSGFDRERAPQEYLAALADGWPAGELRVGFEDAHVSVKQHARLAEIVPSRVTLVPAGEVVEAERAVKDAGEVELIRAAAAVCDDVYDWLREWGIVGKPEREVAVALEHEMRRRGAEGPSFPSIVASGERGALPHAVPTAEPIPRDTLVTLDLGVRMDGYCSDCTRTWATGDVPQDLADAYALVQRAQAGAMAAVRPGMTGQEADAVARDVIAAAGHGEHFGHSLGHGVGIDVHEGPRLARNNDEPLVAGNVVTVEPGVYLPGRGGVRIEDLVVLTEGGRDVLTRTTKDLLVVD
ncbi:MAG: Xaa-Pro aminopeptidase [Solirubrobacteraceae bacterium]|nr:Xaa-Pro aminopeptidase [Solirubrobacteraceae bacterium]